MLCKVSLVLNCVLQYDVYFSLIQVGLYNKIFFYYIYILSSSLKLGNNSAVTHFLKNEVVILFVFKHLQKLNDVGLPLAVMECLNFTEHPRPRVSRGFLNHLRNQVNIVIKIGIFTKVRGR